MRTKTVGVYSFDELSDSAKEKARDWFRQGNLDHDWWEFVYEDAATIAEMLGIDLRQRPVKLHGGGTRYEPAIYFSGFSSQGDGACFEGTYSYKAGSAKAIKSHAPLDKELHRIADALQGEQRRAFYKLSANISHRGHYNHSGCMDIDVNSDHPGEFDADAIRSCLTDFADWIYRQLEKEYDYQNADEQIDENIRANDYEFDEDGERA